MHSAEVMAPEQWLLTSVLGSLLGHSSKVNGGAGAVNFMVTLMYDPVSDWCTEEWGAQPPLTETGRALRETVWDKMVCCMGLPFSEKRGWSPGDSKQRYTQ